MSDPAFDAKSAAFLRWFTAWPGATFHPDIRIEDLRGRGAGRGIVATADIPEDTTLFRIPRAAVLSTRTSDLPRRLPHLFEASTAGLEDASDNEADDDPHMRLPGGGGSDANGRGGAAAAGAPDNWVALILVAIYEFLQGDGSRWKPYLDVLPARFETPMWWDGREVAELQASPVVGRIGRDEADGMFRAGVLPVVQAHADVFYPAGAARLAEDELLALAHRMGSTIMAYAFDLESEDEDEDGGDGEDGDGWVVDREGSTVMGLVPMADILNADAEFNAHVNHGEDCLTVTALRPIPAGAEILNYYGPLGNGELLRRYGYVTSHHARYDVAEISWELVLSVLRDALQLDDRVWGKALNELDLEEIEDAFVIERDSGEPNSRGELDAAATFKELPTDLIEQIHSLLKAIRHVSPDTIPDKAKRDEITLSTIHRALELKLAQYTTSQAYDYDLVSGDKVSGRQKMAAVVRWGEKALLQEAVDFAYGKVEKTRSSIRRDDEPGAKRQKTR